MTPDIRRTIKVLFLTAEAEPFVKVGGLGDYSGSLPKALVNLCMKRNIAIDFRLALPFHKTLLEIDPPLKRITDFRVPSRGRFAKGHLFELKKDLITYYIVGRSGNASGYDQVYNPNQIEDARKYIFFSLACMEFLKTVHWQPDIIHANDWHTAIALYQLMKYRHTDPFYKDIKSLLVIHNLPYLGQGSEPVLKEFGVKPVQNKNIPQWAEFLPLPIGLCSADQILTVSPSYAEELKKEEFGDGLSGFLRESSVNFYGILNGIDTLMWDPSNDPFISSRYSASDLNSRLSNKLYLLSSFGMREQLDKPLLVLISRLTYQKGMDLLLQSLPSLVDEEWSAIILGTGDQVYEAGLIELEVRMPKRLRVILDYSPAMAHSLYAGGDIFLMPSLYEPCGTSQMIAMRYGCVPVARAVGGLKDTIKTNPEKEKTGYLFTDATDQAFIRCLKAALSDYKDKDYWNKVQNRAMNQDFSWTRSATKYLHLYNELITHQSLIRTLI